MRRLAALVVSASLLLQACGSDQSLAEYAEQAETMVATMNSRIDELDAEVSGSQDLDQIKRYARERVAARRAFLDGLNGLDPPDEVAELHDAALEIVTDLTDAEAALADHVQELESIEGIDIWETPQGQAARAADERAIALCKAAEEELDTTEEGEGLEDAPWIPAEMKAIVRVAFGCEATDR